MDKIDKLDELIDGAEDLLTRLADAHDPQVQMLRDRVDGAIRDTRRALSKEAGDDSVPWRDIAGTIDDYVRDYPWLALTTGVLVAGAAAYIAGMVAGTRRSARDG